MSLQGEWHFIVDEAGERRQEGPVSTEALTELASAGKITGDALGWQEGMAEWVPLCEISGFSRFFHQEAPPHTEGPDSSLFADTAAAEAPVAAAEPADIVTLADFANHSVQFSRSRNSLLVVTNDYHADPLELTKLDLLNFLTAMERSAESGSSPSR